MDHSTRPPHALTANQVTALARGILTGEQLVVNFDETAWQASMSVLLSDPTKVPDPEQVALILVPRSIHTGGFWVNGRVPAVTIACRFIGEADAKKIGLAVGRMASALYPDNSPAESVEESPGTD
jgi:hypothetical protein